jgi:uncharacterized protein YbaP (TraB family)
MGTMHVKDIRAFHTIERAKRLIQDCELFAAEMDLDEAAKFQHPEDFQMPESLTLRSQLGKKKFAKYQRQVQKSFGIDLALFDRQYPMLTTNLIAELCLHSDHALPLDTYLWEFATETGKELKGLESFHEQMTIMNQISMDVQMKGLKVLVSNPKKFKQSLRQLMHYYQEEDIDKLYQVSKRSIGKLRKILLYQRNLKMANTAHLFCQKKSSFITLGAAHLSGKKGVLRLMKQRGYRIKPVFS